MDLIGHTEAFQTAQHLIAKSRRVLGLIAPRGVGRLVFARELCRSTNPKCAVDDIKELTQDTITITHVRELDTWVALDPVEADLKYLVIAPGSCITLEAQHALLKLIESPPPRLVLLLLIEASSKVLPAIKSRLHLLRLFHLSRPDSEKIWLSIGIEPSIYPSLWNLAPGQPGVAIARLSKKYPALIQAFNSFYKNSPTDNSLLQWQTNIPLDWSLEDHHEFWLWLIPRLIMTTDRNSAISKFAVRLSDFIQSNPMLETQLGVPVIWHEVTT